MPARPGCCSYTTRRYDSDGEVLWSANYFQGANGAGKYVTSQAISDSRVFVAGDQITRGSGDDEHTWSLVCLDIENGSVLWDFDLGGAPTQIRVDGAGNVVCMMPFNGEDPENDFIVVDPDGDLVRTVTLEWQQSEDTEAFLAPLSFTINDYDDYHILATDSITPHASIYDWATPQSGAATFAEIGEDNGVNGFFDAPGAPYNWAQPLGIIPAAMSRVGNRDLITGGASGPYFINAHFFRGAEQDEAIGAFTDIDLTLPNFLGYPVPVDLELTKTHIEPTGTDQASAAELDAGKDYAIGNGVLANGEFVHYAATDEMTGYTYNATGWLGGPALVANANGAFTFPVGFGNTVYGSLPLRILLTAQADPKYNGQWSLAQVGDATHPAKFIRTDTTIHAAGRVLQVLDPTAEYNGTNPTDLVFMGCFLLDALGDIVCDVDEQNYVGGETPPGCLRLPEGEAGDIVGVNHLSLYAPVYARVPPAPDPVELFGQIFPPAGGRIDDLATDEGVDITHNTFICESPGIWKSYYPWYQLNEGDLDDPENAGTVDIEADLDGNLLFAMATFEDGQRHGIEKFDSNGAPVWQWRGDNALQIATDSLGNIYVAGGEFVGGGFALETYIGAYASIYKLNSDGEYQWGHLNMKALKGPRLIHVDPEGGVVMSGNGSTGGGPQKKSDDIPFRPDPS